jgi:inosose dehydratase
MPRARRWPVRFQTYTWQARHERGHPLPPFGQVVDQVAAAGYDGVETSTTMLGTWFDRPDQVRAALEAAGISLVALAFSPRSSWTDPASREADLAAADRLIAFLCTVGTGQRLALSSGASAPGTDPQAAWRCMIDQYHRVAERARSAGLTVHVHPNSSAHSLVRLGAHYDRLVADLDPGLIEFGPDTGHITRGDETPLALVSRHFARLGHIHLMDARAGGEYAFLGTGDADIAVVVALLRERGYQGWVVAEEESEAGMRDPVATLSRCREYLRGMGV